MTSGSPPRGVDQDHHRCLRRIGRSSAAAASSTLTDSSKWPLRCLALIPAARHHADLLGPDDYLPFTTAGLRAVSRVTVAAIERLESLRPGDPWLPGADVPHVLYRGTIPVSWFARSGTEAAG